MATQVEFIHHTTVDGVGYLPGDVASFSDARAKQLVYNKRARYTDGPPSPTPDPYPQYPREADLDDPSSLFRQKLDALYEPAASLAQVARTGAWGDLTGRPTLAPVASSGAYADLAGIPDVPDDRAELRAFIADLIAAGSNITKTVDPQTGVVTLAYSSGGGGGGGASEARTDPSDPDVLLIPEGAVNPAANTDPSDSDVLVIDTASDAARIDPSDADVLIVTTA